MTAKRMRLLTAGLAIIALIAALFVINPGLGRSAAAAWDGTAAESFEGGNGDSSDPYIIKTAEQLAFLAKQVNGGETYHGKYFQLEADLDLSGSEWSPIGIGERETDGSTVTKPFAGTFDGKNHKISGLTLTAGLDDQGLFGCSSGTIGNLGIVRGNISVAALKESARYADTAPEPSKTAGTRRTLPEAPRAENMSAVSVGTAPERFTAA